MGLKYEPGPMHSFCRDQCTAFVKQLFSWAGRLGSVMAMQAAERRDPGFDILQLNPKLNQIQAFLWALCVKPHKRLRALITSPPRHQYAFLVNHFPPCAGRLGSVMAMQAAGRRDPGMGALFPEGTALLPLSLDGYTHIYIYININKYICIYIYIYTCIQTCIYM